MSEQQLRVLLVDDETSLREPLAKYLRDNYPYQVDTAASGEETWERVIQAAIFYDVVLIDDLLTPRPGEEPEPLGIELMHKIKDHWPETEVIVFTGWGMERALDTLRAGAYRYLAKPFNVDELGITIQMAAEQGRTRRLLKITEREKQWLQTFLEIGMATTSVLELDQVLEQVHKQVGRLMDASGLHIALYDDINRILCFELCFDRGKRQAKWRHPFTSDKGLTDWVIGNSQPLLVRDYPNDSLPVPAHERHYGDESDQEVTRSWLGVPLVVRDKVIGAITVQSYRPHQFDETDQKILATVASQVAIAIENARLFSTLERTGKHLEGLVVSSFDAVVSIDRDKHVTVFNEQAEKMFGYTADEMRGQTVAKLHRDINEARKIWDIVHQQGKIASYKVTLEHKDGTKIPTLLSAVSIKDAKGNEIGQAGFMRDLRQIHLLEERLHALIEAGQAIGGILERDQVLQLVVESAIAAFPTAEKGSIHLYDERTGMLHIRANFGYSQEVVEALTLKAGEGFAGWVYEHETPIVSGNVQGDERFKKLDHSEAREQKSAICVPLGARGRVIGALSLDNLTTFDAFKPDDVGLLSTFAAQAAVAIENAQLFEQTQRDLHIVSHLYETSSQLYPARDLDRSLKLIATSVKEATGALSVSITALDTAGRPYEKAHTGFQDENRVVRRRGLSTIVMRTGEPYIIPDVAKVADIVNPGMIKDGVRSAICLPLQTQSRNIGVMWVTYAQPRSFSEAEIKLLGLLARQTSAVIETARLFQEREFLLDTSKMVSSAQDLDQSLQTLAERLVNSLIVTFCRISLLDDTGRILTPRAAYPIVDDLAWNPGIGQQYPLSESPDEAKAIETGQRQILRQEENPDLLSSLERKTGFQGVLKVAVLIPLTVGGKVFGVITLGERRSWERGSFALERVVLCESVADQVAALILRMRLQEQKARLLEQVSKARDTAKVVAEVSVLEGLQSTLNSVAKGTQDALYCDAVTVYTYDQVKDEFGFPPAMVGVRDTGEVLKFGLVARKSVIRRILALDKARVAENAPSDPLMRGAFVRREKIKSSVGIPLKVGDRKVGVMFVNYRFRHSFTADELTNINLFAHQAAVAICNAQLYEETTRRANALEALYAAGQAVTGTLSLDEILRRIVQQAWRLAERRGKLTHFSHLALVDGNRVKFVAGHPPEAPIILDRAYEIDPEGEAPIGITGRTVVTRQSQLVGNVLENPDYIEIDPRIRSQLSVPIHMGKQVIGVIGVEHPDCNAFGEEDRQTLESLAANAAIAIQNARSYEELKQTKGRVGAMTAVVWMGTVAGAWRHAIGNYATVIEDLVKHICFDLREKAPVSKIEERLSEIEEVISEIRKVPMPPLSTEEGVESVFTNQLVAERIEQLGRRKGRYETVAYELHFAVNSKATVRASPEWLRRVLDILVDNAVNAMADVSIKRLTVITRPADGGVEIAITDTGKGIPEDARSKLFEKPIEKPRGAKGTGLGLFLARAILQTYGGKLDVVSTGPTGTTMVVWLPLEP